MEKNGEPDDYMLFRGADVNDVATWWFQTSNKKLVQTCSLFKEDFSRANLAAGLAGILIIIMNFVIKIQIQSLVESMKIVSKTEEKIFQMIGVTFMQFFNTAIILFLLSLDFE